MLVILSQWIFSMDGFFFFVFLVNSVKLLQIGTQYKFVWTPDLQAGLLVSLGVYFSYVFSNVVFLWAMRRRRQLIVNMMILLNSSMALSLTIALLYWAADDGTRYTWSY